MEAGGGGEKEGKCGDESNWNSVGKLRAEFFV